jgi:hypothetical protein
MVYGCDPAWWKHRSGLPEFTGLKVAWAGAKVDFPDLLRVEIARESGHYGDRMTFDAVGKIGGGGNSGFQALNLVAQLGAARVVLIGFDMSDRTGRAHWYGRNGWTGANNPDESAFRRWRPALDAAAPVLATRGVEVVNASPDSALKAFRKTTLSDVLDEWGIG